MHSEGKVNMVGGILLSLKKESDQCKEIEENNRIGKIRDFFKKIRDTKGTAHAKMSQ